MPHLRSLRLVFYSRYGNPVLLLKGIISQAQSLTSLDLIIHEDEGGWSQFLDWCASRSRVQKIVLRGPKVDKANLNKASYTWIEVL